MTTIEESNITSRNLDRLAALLSEQHNDTSEVVEQIPHNAHVFHGAYNDEPLTHANLQLASRILLGMTLGYVDEAPMVMIFEDRAGSYRIIDLLDEAQRKRAKTFVETFQQQGENMLSEQLTA